MSDYRETVVSTMQQKRIESWVKQKKRTKTTHRGIIYAAAIISLAAGSAYFVKTPEAIDVMSHIDSGFEYDDTLGRLQYVSNILPKSAMVFLNNTEKSVAFTSPTSSELLHSWNPDEPWERYAGKSDVYACCDGEVAAIVKNRNDEYTVRIIHENGYESVYSGLTSVFVQESDILISKECIGYAEEETAFELRKDGVSIIPAFKKP